MSAKRINRGRGEGGEERGEEGRGGGEDGEDKRAERRREVVEVRE